MEMEYRGLSETCFQMIKTIPGLQTLMQRICSAPECSAEIRHNYLNCYYRGGSMFKLKFNTKSKTLTFEFDEKYFNLQGTTQEDYAELKALVKKSKDPSEWLDRLGEIKQVMDRWFQENPKAERGVQQELAKSNTFAQGAYQTKGTYQAIDIELAIPGHQELGRMDMIAVRREEKKYIPVIVELKHGTKAFNGTSGIKKHYEKTTAFLNLEEPEGEAYLVETIRKIWATKANKQLGLLQGPVPALEDFGKAELMFAVTGWPNGDIEVIRRDLPDVLDRKVWVVTSPDRELYFDQAELLPEKLVK